MWVQVTTNKDDVFRFRHTTHDQNMKRLQAIMQANYPDAKVVRMDIK
jgi:hypothetical protein